MLELLLNYNPFVSRRSLPLNCECNLILHCHPSPQNVIDINCNKRSYLQSCGLHFYIRAICCCLSNFQHQLNSSAIILHIPFTSSWQRCILASASIAISAFNQNLWRTGTSFGIYCEHTALSWHFRNACLVSWAAYNGTLCAALFRILFAD